MWKNFSGICGEKKPTIVEEFFRKIWNDYRPTSLLLPRNHFQAGTM